VLTQSLLFPELPFRKTEKSVFTLLQGHHVALIPDVKKLFFQSSPITIAPLCVSGGWHSDTLDDY
jgi:hypothetical protein